MTLEPLPLDLQPSIEGTQVNTVLAGLFSECRTPIHFVPRDVRVGNGKQVAG